MKKIIIIIILFIVMSFYIKAQTKYEFKIDTMYHISLFYSNTPKRPSYSGWCFVKDINNYYVCLDNYDSIKNTFYKNSFYSFDLEWEFYRTLSSKFCNSYDSAYNKLYAYNMDKINGYTLLDTIYNKKDSTYVILSVKKIIAQFYKEDISNRITATISIPLDTLQYKYNYFYRFIKILNCEEIPINYLNIIR